VFPAQVIDGETLDVARDAAAERIAVFGLSYVSTETNGYPNPHTAKQGVFKEPDTKATPVLITDAQVKEFMQMVWKKNEKVAIGYFDALSTTVQLTGAVDASLVVYWYCAGTTDFSTHKDNVGEACLKLGKTGGTEYYNDCFNQIQLKEHNKLRFNHQADAVQIEKELAANIETSLAKATTLTKDVKDCWK